jgi:hypothetical protein
MALTSVKLGPETAILPVTGLPMRGLANEFSYLSPIVSGPIAPINRHTLVIAIDENAHLDNFRCEYLLAEQAVDHIAIRC